MRCELSHPARRWMAYLLVAVLIGGGAATWLSTYAAPLQGPGAGERRVTLIVRGMIKEEHLSRHPLDDEISHRTMKMFLEGFDPRKMYFTQADIDEFKTKENDLDDEVNHGDVRFAYLVFNRYLQRLDERIKLVEELVNTPHDFTKQESIVTDADVLTYPQNDAEIEDRWRKLIKLNLLTLKSDDISEAEAKAKILRRYHTLAKRWHQTDSDELLERFLSAVTMAYDPHSTYMSPSSLDNFNIVLGLNLEGIGAALQLSDEGFTVVSKVIPGGAADKDGRLKPDDRIVSVGNNRGEMLDTIDMKLNDVVQMIRGPAGTTVKIGVQNTEGGETKVYEITRAKIELDDSAARGVILERGQKPDGSPYKIGVIDLPSFYMDMRAARESDGHGEFRSTTRDVRRILQDFNDKHVEAVVLNLRENGGGSLTEAINLTGLFIDEGPVVQVKDSEGRVQSYNDLEPGMAWDGPLVVLTSKFSASASEILAGCIQDYHRGLIIGDESTHGKGTVQSLLDLGNAYLRIPNPPPLGALKITMQQFYRPNGDSTQQRGVIPDLILPSLTNEIGLGEGDLDYAIAFDRVPTSRFATYNLVSPDTVTGLKNRSAARISGSEDFAKELARIERYQKLKDEKSISLNEAEYKARREAERDAEEEEEKHFDESQQKDEVFRDDFYNREVIEITLEYVKEVANNQLARAR